MRWTRGVVLAAVALCGCGERTPSDDALCPKEAPRAFSSPPRFAKCEEVRTNEARIDPATKAVIQDHVHRYVHCCR